MGTLRIKSSIELKSQIQDFLDLSPYAEQLQGLLALSEEELQNPNAVQKFLEQQHLDSQIWDEYIDKLKVRKLLEKDQYFVNLDTRWHKPLLETNFDLISFFNRHGFLGEKIHQTSMFIKGINIHPMPKDQLLKKLQFFIDKKILTPSNIYFLPRNLFYLSVPLIEYLEKISFFDNNPFFEEEKYFVYELSVFQQYLVLFCMGQENNELGKYETREPIIDYYRPDFSEKLLRLIEVTKKTQPKDWILFFNLMHFILAEDNYQDLFIKLQQEPFISHQYTLSLLCSTEYKKIGEFLDMDDEIFISLSEKIEHLRRAINEDLLRSILSELFQYDNYSEILSNLCIEALEKLKNSKVPELKYSLVSFLSFILESSDPLNTLNALETIYSSSHLPQIVKNFSLFRLLYDDQKLEQIISNGGTISPYLKGLPTEERVPAIYKDFLNIAINSNEASLRNLITQLVDGIPLLRKFETWLQKFKQKQSMNNLSLRFSPEEQNQLFQLFEALENLPFMLHPEKIDRTSFKRKTFSQDQPEAYYHYLLGKLKVSEGTSLADACDQSFARWGYPQLEGILNNMDEGRKLAMTTNAQKLETNLTVNQGDFLKGVKDPETILQILQTGILSREYIGAAGADSDTTPFDADFQELVKRGDKQALADFLEATYAAEGGSYLFLIKDPNQLFGAKKGYEKIIHNYQGHRGIRTGLPTTAISALIMPEELKSEELQAFTYQIAKNGFYLPIYDRNGKLLFTLEDYAQLRKGFAFSPRYEGYTLTTDQTVEKEKNPDLKDLTPQQGYRESSDQAESLSHFTAKKIQTYLKELGIFVSLEQRKSDQEASLFNIGSTGRGTATDLSAQDQDFVLILPPQYADQKEKIVAHLHEKMQTSKKAENEGPRENGAYQLRSEVNKMGENGSSLPFDLLIMENIHGVQLSSAQAMKERLEHILKTQGQSAYNAVLSNIRAAKSLLAQHKIYKRTDGGLGGIGVEHWILQNEGSLEKALKSFASVAYQGGYHPGEKPLSLEDFQKQYPIYDTGYNWKNGTIDNYILKMDQSVYDGILSLARNSLKEDF